MAIKNRQLPQVAYTILATCSHFVRLIYIKSFTKEPIVDLVPFRWSIKWLSCFSSSVKREADFLYVEWRIIMQYATYLIYTHFRDTMNY